MFTSFVLIVGLLFQNPPESQLDKVLEKHRKSIKVEYLNSAKTLAGKGDAKFYVSEEKYCINSPYLTGTFKELIKRPDKRYYEHKLKNVDGTYRYAQNNNFNWAIGGGGLKSSTLDEKAMLRSKLTLDIVPNLLNLDKRGFSPEYFGKRKIDNQIYHCIQLTHSHGIHIYYLDIKSCLVSIVVFKDRNLEENSWSKYYFQDYKIVDNIIFPHTRIEKVNMPNDMITQVYRYTNVRINESIDPSIFKAPENP